MLISRAVKPITDLYVSRYVLHKAKPQASDKVPAVVITGGSRGIGKALAKLFAQEGHTVILIARGEEGLREAAEDILKADPSAVVRTLALDITAPDAVSRLKAGVSDHGCMIDVLVNNAGLGAAGLFLNQTPDELDALLALNVSALTRLTRAVLPDLLAEARGGIINIGSLGGYTPGPQQAAYYASKAYVQSLTEAVAFECRGRGVRILVAMPGPVGTQFHSQMGANNAIYRWILPAHTPDGVARAILRAYWLGRTTTVPGIINKCLAIGARFLPHPLLLPLINALLHPLKRNSS